tara:strand:+ start:142 stop:273 length:132 start_codon:yes stop_codon:yes gene_type:complete
MVSFKEFMSETHYLSRWQVLGIGILGAFCGALITVSYLIGGLL